MHTLHNPAWWPSSSFPEKEEFLNGGDHVLFICGSLKNQKNITYTIATQKKFNELKYLLAASGMNHSVLRETNCYS